MNTKVYIRFTAQTAEQTYVRNYINYIMVQTLHSCKRKKQADSHSDAGSSLLGLTANNVDLTFEFEV